MVKYTNKLIEDIVNKEIYKYKKIEDNIDKGILVHGFGFVGKWAIKYLLDNGIDVKYIVDKNESKCGKMYMGVEIVSPDDRRILDVPNVLITAVHAVNAVKKSYSDRFIVMPFLGWYLIKHYEEYKEVRDNYMEDEKSQITYNALLYCMLTGDESACRDVMESNAYFSIPGFGGVNGFENEVFVDAGAYVGDSVERFIWENLGAFEKVYAFEPGEHQCKALNYRIERLSNEWGFAKEKISIVKAGLGEKRARMYIPKDDTLELINTCLGEEPDFDLENEVIEIHSLDEFMEGKRVSFIKADIEGMEMALLQGAKDTIRRYKPKMTICVYHYPCDLYSIAKYIRSINPEYKFKLRHHAAYLFDYVLYCY